jgi:glycosyltransferase involved in cell wall biosynthesis
MREKNILNNQVKISIVVPVCNVERYVEQCVRSLMNQTMQELEFICMDDGSTDTSGEILDRLALEDARIRVVHKANSGYGDTMNQGFALAQGEYIGILESDDFAEPDMYERLYATALEHDADIVKCNFNAYHTDSGEKVLNDDLQQVPYHQVFTELQTMFVIPPAIWAGIYRRSYLEEHKIQMLPTPGASFQDTGFAFKVMVCNPRLVTIPEGLLNYRVDNAGSSVKDTRKVFNICDEMHSIREFIESNNRMSLMGVYERVKCIRYRWNLDRLGGDAQMQFMEVMHDEFVQDDADGFLIREYWTDGEWDYVQKLIHEYDGFRKKYLGS